MWKTFAKLIQFGKISFYLAKLKKRLLSFKLRNKTAAIVTSGVRKIEKVK